jgi:hypothetical protein
MRFCFRMLLVVAGVSVCLQGQDIKPTLAVPQIDASLSIGFNYDFLRAPTNVSYDYPKGYIGLNIPIKYGVGQDMANSISAGLFADSMFINGEEFRPTVSAQQYANTTVRVDVPMWGGVATFSNIQNFYLRYNNVLGEPNMAASSKDATMNLFLRGMVNVPLDIGLGWETMTFGYAYKINDQLQIALNLHRHLFRFDLSAKVDVDLLGYLDVAIPNLDTSRTNLSYSSNDVYGRAYGNFRSEVWSPTFGINLWRFTLTSRFGFNTVAKGRLTAQYQLPFFINPENFKVEEFSTGYLTDNLNRFRRNDVDSIWYGSDRRLTWNMPQGHSISFDIIPEKLFISYTKFFGGIEMGLDSITTKRFTTSGDSTIQSIDFSIGVNVDHIIMLHGVFRNAFVNLGVFSLDFSFMEKKRLLQTAMKGKWVMLGDGIMIPVLNLGTTIGSKIQFLAELDILPLPALKTGVIYYF